MLSGILSGREEKLQLAVGSSSGKRHLFAQRLCRLEVDMNGLAVYLLFFLLSIRIYSYMNDLFLRIQKENYRGS